MPGSTGPMTVGAVIVVLGLLATFAGARIRGRLPGLAVMAFGTVTMLVTAGPAHLRTVWIALLAASTLIGMLTFGVLLARRIDPADEQPDPRGIDEARR